ncbi:tetratricopeptide repeat protein [Pelomicrobium sp.]|uniref:tetratricopeptide repeat protein n=1 Tax=Pelomicrobium sp. TaxID=2815319 RepID=UPI002FDC7DA3
MTSRCAIRFGVIALLALAAPHPASAVSLELLVPRTSPPGAPKTEGTPVQDKLQAGYAALNGNDLTEAAKAFTQAHALDPKAPEPLLGLAEVARLKKDLKGVEHWLRKALAAAPEDAAVQRAWGRYEFVMGRHSAAEAAFQKAIRLDPKSAGGYLDLGDLYMTALHKPKEAAEAYGEAARLAPRHGGAHHGLGMALAAQRRFDEAEAAFRKAAALSPGNPLPLQALGRLHLSRGKLEPALAAFNELLEAHPDFVPARLDRGDLFMAKGEHDKAIADYQRAAQAAPKNADAQFKLGTAYHGSGRMVEAEKAYRAALKADPRHAPAHNNLAWLLAQSGQRLDEALRLAQKAVALSPGVGTFHDTLGTIHLLRGELDPAIAAFQKAAGTQPPQAEFYYRLGVAHRRKGNRQEAIAALKRALEIQKDFPYAADARKELEKLGGG